MTTALVTPVGSASTSSACMKTDKRSRTRTMPVRRAPVRYMQLEILDLTFYERLIPDLNGVQDLYDQVWANYYCFNYQLVYIH